MQRRTTNHFFIYFCRRSLPLYISCVFIEDTITKNDFFHKNSFYKNFSLVPSLPFKNKDLALTLENWKRLAIKLSTKPLLHFINIKYSVKECGLVFVFNSSNSRFLFFFLSTLSALNNFLHNYDFVMIIMRDFSASKESHKRSFHVDIPKVPI